jgi:hypothetical protein
MHRNITLVTGYGLNSRGVGVRFPVGVGFFSSPRRSDRFWGPSSLLSSGYRGLFPRGESGRGVKLTNHLQLLPRLRIRGSIHSLPIRLNGVVLHYLSAGTTLSLPISYFLRNHFPICMCDRLPHFIYKDIYTGLPSYKHEIKKLKINIRVSDAIRIFPVTLFFTNIDNLFSCVNIDSQYLQDYEYNGCLMCFITHWFIKYSKR